MTRVKRGVTTRKRHKKILKLAKGYRGMRSTTFKKANEAVMKAGTNAYRDRRLKKRTFRRLWITRINSAARAHGLSYSRLMNGLLKAMVAIDRKVLAEIAVKDEKAFKAIVEKAKAAL